MMIKYAEYQSQTQLHLPENGLREIWVISEVVLYR